MESHFARRWEPGRTFRAVRRLVQRLSRACRHSNEVICHDNCQVRGKPQHNREIKNDVDFIIRPVYNAVNQICGLLNFQVFRTPSSIRRPGSPFANDQIPSQRFSPAAPAWTAISEKVGSNRDPLTFGTITCLGRDEYLFRRCFALVGYLRFPSSNLAKADQKRQDQ